MNGGIFVVGDGGREHAMVDALKRSGAQVGVATQNAGMITDADCNHLGEVDLTDFEAARAFLLQQKYAIALVGPEGPLANGFKDVVGQDVPVAGPNQAAAKLEASKVFSKHFMRDNDIPTADFDVFNASERAQCEDCIRARFDAGEPKVVLKADGLAAGKGVILVSDMKEANTALDAFFGSRRFGDAGDTILVEECLEGPEFSVFALLDEHGNFVEFKWAQDYKREYDGDEGENTGGMGALVINKLPGVKNMDSLAQEVRDQIMLPTIAAINDHPDMDYAGGMLYFGLMLTQDGPKVIEYNCRFGDPETQVVLPTVENYADLITASVGGGLAKIRPRFNDLMPATVVAAASDYPRGSSRGQVIIGLPQNEYDAGVKVFHAGTKHGKHFLRTNGGRVLAVTGLRIQPRNSLIRANQAASEVKFDGEPAKRRTDIGSNAEI